MEHFEVSANGLTFPITAAGPPDGRPVIFLHGFPATSWAWHNALDAVAAQGYRGVTFDQRGYAATARPLAVHEYAIGHLVTDVLAVADALGAETFDVVGHDWGAMVAWTLAARHADRVRTLTALSVPHPVAFGAALHGGDEDQAKRSSYMDVFRQEGVPEKALLGEDGLGEGLRLMFAASGMPADAAEVDAYVAAMVEPGALTAALNWYRAMSPESMGDVGMITVPTLYMWSTADIAIGRVAAENTAQLVSGPYRFEVLEDVSHWIPETAPDALASALLEHLRAY